MSARATPYHCTLRALREHCPPLLPVRVVRRKGLGRDHSAWGQCTLKKDAKGKPSRFLIELEADMVEPGLSHILIHEWAHALAWTTGKGTLHDHGSEFEHAVGRAYRAHEATP